MGRLSRGPYRASGRRGDKYSASACQRRGPRNPNKNSCRRDFLRGVCPNRATSEVGRKPQAFVPAGGPIAEPNYWGPEGMMLGNEGKPMIRSAPAACQTHSSTNDLAHRHR